MDDELERLRRAYETMPDPERQVFERARFRNLDYRQIAVELEIEIAEVTRRMSRAIRHLTSE